MVAALPSKHSTGKQTRHDWAERFGKLPPKQTKLGRGTWLSDEIAVIAAQRDEELDLSEMPEVIDWSGAEVAKFYRPPKKPVTMRFDADVVEWLKSYGPGYQTKTNMLLRHAMHSTRAAKSGGNDP